MLRLLALLALAYLIGSIPSGLWLGRLLAGIDVRSVGSQRTGATNVQRSLGTGAAVTVLIVDALKGTAAVVAVRALGGSPSTAALAGFVAVVGHVWPVLADFRGGRGVATGAGAFLALAPLALLATLAVMVVVAAITRYGSRGSIAAAVTATVWAAILRGVWGESDATLLFILPTIALVLIKHSDNLLRLRLGTERRLGRRTGSQPAHTS